MSSAYSLTLHLISAGKSLIKHKKSYGPNAEPCGTTEVTSDGLLCMMSSSNHLLLSLRKKTFSSDDNFPEYHIVLIYATKGCDQLH